MQYLGSKNRISQALWSVMCSTKTYDRLWVEPFAGGMNMIDKVIGNHWANDINKYLIATFKALLDGWQPPTTYSEDEYHHIARNKSDYPEHVVGYVGFSSFTSKWFAGYPHTTQGRDYYSEYRKNIMKQVIKLRGVKFTCMDYRLLDIPADAIVYCDPPYENTTKYNSEFNHIHFWQWVRKLPNTVYVSSYTAPKDFKCIWSANLNNNINSKSMVERLWVTATTGQRI